MPTRERLGSRRIRPDIRPYLVAFTVAAAGFLAFTLAQSAAHSNDEPNSDQLPLSSAVGHTNSVDGAEVSGNDVVSAFPWSQSSSAHSDVEAATADDTQQPVSEGDSTDVMEQQRDIDNAEGAVAQAAFELEAEGPSTDDGTGIKRTSQVLVEKPPITGSGGSFQDAEAGDSSVKWAVIVLLIAVAMVAADWALRRGNSSK